VGRAKDLPALPHTEYIFLSIVVFGGFVCVFAKLQKMIISFVTSVCNNSAPTGRIFVKFDI